MSFEKARDLCHLAQMAGARHQGVSLEEIRETFHVSHRTAQRMVQMLDEVFGPLEVLTGPDRRHRWKLPRENRAAPALREDEALEALDLAIREAQTAERHRHARALARVRDTLLHRLGPAAARRAETDAEAVLSALETVARPGPRSRICPKVADAVYDAIKGPYVLRLLYPTAKGGETWREVEPYGVLLGPRSYLVARVAGETRHFRMDRITQAECTSRIFALDENFSLQAHAARSFAAFHNPAEYGPVRWRFSPKAAPIAADYVFHPNQQLSHEADGSLTVSFEASGWLEMTWFLYQWGAEVEVLEPAPLRNMVHSWRREFPALP